MVPLFTKPVPLIENSAGGTMFTVAPAATDVDPLPAMLPPVREFVPLRVSLLAVLMVAPPTRTPPVNLVLAPVMVNVPPAKLTTPAPEPVNVPVDPLVSPPVKAKMPAAALTVPALSTFGVTVDVA